MLSVDEIFQRWRSKWLVGLLEAFIFHLIEQKERYGGELVKMSKEVLAVDVKVPTIYGILNRALDLELLEESGQTTEHGVTRGTSRKYYKLTSRGREYYALMLSQITALEDILGNDLSKLNKEGIK